MQEILHVAPGRDPSSSHVHGGKCEWGGKGAVVSHVRLGKPEHSTVLSAGHHIPEGLGHI